MIIGTIVSEAWWVYCGLKTIHCGEPHDPIAIRSCLGFSLLGYVEGEPKRQRYNVHHIHTTDAITLYKQVEEFWEVVF